MPVGSLACHEAKEVGNMSKSRERLVLWIAFVVIVLGLLFLYTHGGSVHLF
jgi:hypothetical protein